MSRVLRLAFRAFNFSGYDQTPTTGFGRVESFSLARMERFIICFDTNYNVINYPDEKGWPVISAWPVIIFLHVLMFPIICILAIIPITGSVH